MASILLAGYCTGMFLLGWKIHYSIESTEVVTKPSIIT